MGPRAGEHPRRQTNTINEQDSARAATLRKAREVCRAMALYSKIHGLKNVHRAEGQ